MKKSKNHHFTHLDPEKALPKNSNQKSFKAETVSRESLQTAKDLRHVLAAIIAFTGALMVLYLLNIKFDLLQKFTNLVHF